MLINYGRNTLKCKDHPIDALQSYLQFIRQISMLEKKQGSANPATIDELVLLYITPLEDIVKHFESLFLASAAEESVENDGASVANLDITEKNEAKHDLLTAINPYIETFFELAFKFIELPVSYCAVKYYNC